MQESYASPPQPEQQPIHWLKESLIGTLISAIFTVMALYSGSNGVEDASLPSYMHDFIVAGGVLMLAVCGACTLCLGAVHILKRMGLQPGLEAPQWFGQLQHAKFIKIFLP